LESAWNRGRHNNNNGMEDPEKTGEPRFISTRTLWNISLREGEWGHWKETKNHDHEQSAKVGE